MNVFAAVMCTVFGLAFGLLGGLPAGYLLGRHRNVQRFNGSAATAGATAGTRHFDVSTDLQQGLVARRISPTHEATHSVQR